MPLENRSLLTPRSQGFAEWAALLFALLATLGQFSLAGPAYAAGKATSFTLSNGLQIVVIPDHRLPIVTHMVYVRAGSADDPPGKSGLAHYLEHLMFKGTANYPTGQYDLIVTHAGGTNNAFTSTDKTYYYEQILKEGLPQIMALDADRLAGLAFAPSEAESELKVVEEERRAYDNDPESVLAQNIGRRLYDATPYAHPVLGEPAELARLTMSDAMAFHRAHYGASMTTVVVSGDVEPDDVRKMANDTYGRLPAGEPVARPALDMRTAACVSGHVGVRSGRVARTRISLHYLTPGSLHMAAPDAAAVELLADILQSEVTSPLWADLVTQQRLANDIKVSHDLRMAAGEFTVTVEAAETVAPERLERAAREAMISSRRNGIDAESLAIAKRRWLASTVLASDDQLAVATDYGEQIAAGRSVEEVEGEGVAVAGVTVADINAILKTTLSNRCYLTGVLMPAPDAAATGVQPKQSAHPAAAVH